MKQPKLSDIAGIINKKFPFTLAEDWDNTGIQLGDPTAGTGRIMVALDPLPDVIRQAISKNCQLLVTHHPLVFSPLKQITSSTTTGRCLLEAARNNLALLSMHTNYDIASGGLNDLLAARLGLDQVKILKVTGHEKLCKLAVFVPDEHLEQVRSALLPFAESIGNYKDCSFASSGEGTFFPMEGATPAIGKTGFLEKTPEKRLELLIRQDRLPKVLNLLSAVHPYEEPAFDCFPLLQEAVRYGIGRYGILPESVALEKWVRTAGRQLGCTALRFVGDPERKIRKVAICSGSGASLIKDAVRSGSDVMLTGDVKYHDAREAENLGIALVDAGHFYTEVLMVEAIRDFLADATDKAGYHCEILTASLEQEPFRTVCIDV